MIHDRQMSVGEKPDGHDAFRLHLPGLEADPGVVEALVGQEGLSEGFTFRVRLRGSQHLDPEHLIERPVRLELGGEGEAARRVEGVVTGVARSAGRGDGSVLRLAIHSPLAGLAGARSQHVLYNRDALGMAQHILAEGTLGALPVHTRVERALPDRGLAMQAAETDLALLQRILARDGLLLVLTPSGREAVITEDLATAGLPRCRLQYRPYTGQVPDTQDIVLRLERRLELQPGRVRVGGLDPRYPEASGAAEVDLAGGGARQVHHGVVAGGRREHERWARQVQAAHAARREGMVITTPRRLAPGMRVTVTGLPWGEGEAACWVERVVHQGEQTAALEAGDEAATPHYTCRAWLRPVEAGVAPMPRPAPASGGLAVARVEGPDPERAHVDGGGAYRVRLESRQEAGDEGSASPPVHAVLPHGGGEYGCHLPLRPGARVAVAGLHGDPEQPVIVGALSTGQAPGPVSETNPYQHVIRSARGHELCLDDHPAGESVRLTAAGVGRLTLAREGDAVEASLAAPEGELELYSGGGMHVVSDAHRRTEVGGDYRLACQGRYEVEAEQGGLDWHAGGSASLVAEAGDLYQAARSGAIRLEAGGGMTLDAEGDLTLVAQGGEGAWEVAQGGLTLSADGEVTVLSTSDEAITVGGSSGLRIEPDGTVRIEGSTLELAAGEIHLSADRIAENG